MLSKRYKIAVIGGTGFIGYHIVNELLRLNYEVSIITRNPWQDVPGNWKGYVSFTKLDAQKANEDEFKIALLKHQGLIFAAGADPGDKDFWEKNVTAVKRLITGARRAGCDRAVLLGSYFTYFRHHNPEFGEMLQQKHTYVASRIEQTNKAREVGGDAVSVAALEIPWVFGVTPGRASLWKDLIAWTNSNFPLFAPSGGTAVVSVETVAEVAVAALQARSNKNIPVAEANYSWAELFNKLTPAKRRVHHIPYWIMAVVGFAWELYAKLTRRPFHGLNPRHFLSHVFTRELFVNLSECRKSEQELGLKRGNVAATRRMDASFTNTINSCLIDPDIDSLQDRIRLCKTSMATIDASDDAKRVLNNKKLHSLINKIAKVHILKLATSHQNVPDALQSVTSADHIIARNFIKSDSSLFARWNPKSSEYIFNKITEKSNTHDTCNEVCNKEERLSQRIEHTRRQPHK